MSYNFPEFIKKAHGIYQALRGRGIPPEFIFLEVDEEKGIVKLLVNNGENIIEYYVGDAAPGTETRAVALMFSAFDSDATESERNQAYLNWFENTNQEMFQKVLVEAGYTPGKEIARA